MKNKINLRSQLTLVRMVKINKIMTAHEGDDARTILHCWWDFQLEKPQ